MAVLGHYYLGGGGYGRVSKSALTRAPPKGAWGHAPLEIFFQILGPLRWVLVQSESVELWILHVAHVA